MKKQTAVEWLMENLTEIKKDCRLSEISLLFNQAKAMEKEQIIDTFQDSRILSITNNCSSGEQYYNEQFKQDNL
jgi:hypothetical protein